MSPLLIDLHQMVDMALATPEMGCINVPVLHALLRCIVYEIAVPEHRVEFHGPNHALMEQVVAKIPHPSPVDICEFCICDPKKPNKRTPTGRPDKSKKVTNILQINTKQIPQNPPGFPLQPLHIIISMSELGIMCDGSMHDAMAPVLPPAAELLKEEDCANGCLAQMTRLLNTAKRVDAVEIGLRKLAEMVACVAAQCLNSDDDDDDDTMSYTDDSDDSDDSESIQIDSIQSDGDSQSEYLENEVQYPSVDGQDLRVIRDNLESTASSENHQDIIDDGKKSPRKQTSPKPSGKPPRKSSTKSLGKDSGKPLPQSKGVNMGDTGKSSGKHDNTKSRTSEKQRGKDRNRSRKSDDKTGPDTVGTKKTSDDRDTKRRIDRSLSRDAPVCECDQTVYVKLQDEMNNIKGEICLAQGRLSTIETGLCQQKLSAEGHFNNTFTTIEQLSNFTQQLQQEFDNRLAEILSRINNSDVTFAALVEGAQRDFTCSILKLQNMLVNTMIEVQQMLDAKVDKLSIPQLKEFITDRLNEFHGTLEFFRKEFGMVPDAAGTTAMLLRNVDCLSCKKMVTQKDREDPPFMPRMKDSIPQKVLCPPAPKPTLRYTGGSHTITTSEERYSRKGNFVKQFGDIGENVKGDMTVGTDGRIYRTKVSCCCRFIGRIE